MYGATETEKAREAQRKVNNARIIRMRAAWQARQAQPIHATVTHEAIAAIEANVERLAEQSAIVRLERDKALALAVRYGDAIATDWPE